MQRHTNSSQQSHSGIDRVFLALVLVEVVFGLVMLASASGPLSFSRFHSSWYYTNHQLLFGILPGIVGLLVFSRIDYRWLQRAAPWLFFASLLSMLLVFIPGIAAHYGTARSWILVGGAFSIQPIEILKITFILYVSALLATPGDGARGVRTAVSLIPVGVAFGAAAFLLMLQPDLGGLMLFAGVLITLMFASGVRLIYVFSLIAAGAALFFFFVRSAAYRAARLLVFLHPELDPQGIGYQINQALLAIGSGGFFGLGVGHSRQKFAYLPEVINDSIFPIIAEELGFFISLGLIALIVAIFFRGLAIARGTRDQFARLMVIGIVGWLTLQSFLNIGAMLGLLPLTGLPLPFISYGGTAMVASLSAVGIVLSISRGTGRG